MKQENKQATLFIDTLEIATSDNTRATLSLCGHYELDKIGFTWQDLQTLEFATIQYAKNAIRELNKALRLNKIAHILGNAPKNYNDIIELAKGQHTYAEFTCIVDNDKYTFGVSNMAMLYKKVSKDHTISVPNFITFSELYKYYNKLHGCILAMPWTLSSKIVLLGDNLIGREHDKKAIQYIKDNNDYYNEFNNKSNKSLVKQLNFIIGFLGCDVVAQSIDMKLIKHSIIKANNKVGVLEYKSEKDLLNEIIIAINRIEYNLDKKDNQAVEKCNMSKLNELDTNC